MARALQAIRAYCVHEQERVLYQIALVCLFIGLGISNSLIELGKGFMLLAFLIALFRARIDWRAAKNPLMIVVAIFFAWILLTNIASVRLSIDTNALWKRNPIHFFVPFLASYFLFDLKRDRYLLIFFFLAALLNATQVIPPFIERGARDGGFLGTVMHPAMVWPSLLFLNVGVIGFVKRPLIRLIWALVFAVNIFAFVAMQSSMAIFIVACLLVPFVIMLVPTRAGTIISYAALFFLIMSIFMFQNTLLPRFLQSRADGIVDTRSTGVEVRSYLWSGSLELIERRPCMGTGSGNWNEFFYGKTRAGLSYEAAGYEKGRHFHAHNNFLVAGVEHGIPGLLLYALIVVLVLVYGARFIRQISDTAYYPVMLGLFFSFIAFILQGISDYTLFAAVGGNLFWLFLGIFFGLSGRFSAFDAIVSGPATSS